MITKHEISRSAGRIPESREYELFHQPPWGGWNKIGNYQSRIAALHAARTVVQTDNIIPHPSGTSFRIVDFSGVHEEIIITR